MMTVHSMLAADADVLDENLGRLRDAGPEYGGTLTNHAPMVAEALVSLRRPELVVDWISAYLPQLDEPFGPLEPIPATRWRTALGDLRRATDWQTFFATEIARDGWRTALHTWWPRLLPGVAAGATHGVIRASHAVRGLAAGDTEERRAEFATALAYWAARYAPSPACRSAPEDYPSRGRSRGSPCTPGASTPA